MSGQGEAIGSVLCSQVTMSLRTRVVLTCLYLFVSELERCLYFLNYKIFNKFLIHKITLDRITLFTT